MPPPNDNNICDRYKYGSSMPLFAAQGCELNRASMRACSGVDTQAGQAALASAARHQDQVHAKVWRKSACCRARLPQPGGSLIAPSDPRTVKPSFASASRADWHRSQASQANCKSADDALAVQTVGACVATIHWRIALGEKAVAGRP
jgi:hypothetical protein